MTVAAASLVSASSRPLRLRRRADLVVQRQHYQGRAWWVVKDPLTLRYYRFHEEEFAILEMIDGRASLDQIQQQFQERFPPQKITLGELNRLVGMLHQSALVVSDAPDQGRQLLARGRKQARRERLAAASNVLSFRFKGVDPDRVLTWLHRRIGWLFSAPAVIACMVLWLTALLLLGVQWDVFVTRLPQFHEFFALHNWFYLAATLALTKVLHEFGHGLACKRLGGECHEMGVMLLVLTPCLYCNVSDSWLLPNRWHRAAIGAAGMYVELTVAAVCTLLWWFSTPGLLHYLCLNVMFVCSVSTLLFNANPLLRYDGYYILSDLTEIPNLRQKASSILQRKAGKWLLGLPERPDPFLPERNQAFFAAFSVAAAVYRWIVVLSILWFLNRVFAPYGLQVIGQMIALAALYGLIVMPLWRLFQFFYVPGRVEQVKLPRMLFSASLATLLVVGLFLAPLPHRVTCPLTVEPRDAALVYVDLPGRLSRIHVRPGEQVAAGQPLVTLESVDAHLVLARLVQQRDQLAARLDHLRRAALSDESAALRIAEVQETLATVGRRIENRAEELQRLTIVAPRQGTVLSVPPRGASPQGGMLPQWTDSPLEAKNLGAYLEAGTPLCRVGDPERLDAIVAIDQADVERICADQRVDIQLAQSRGTVVRSRIAQVSRLDRHDAQRRGAQWQDDRSVTPTANTAAGWNIAYQASVPLELTTGGVFIGTTGKARIHAGYQTVAQRLGRYLARTFNFQR